nr:hypothetical protein [Tanacetum cinerariifolium]
MLADAKLPVTFLAEAVNTACYVQNRVLVNKSHNKTPYELFNGRTPSIRFLKPFGCHVMILNTLDNLKKFEAKGDEGYFNRYSMSSKAFRVFNKRTKRVEENMHVDFLENKAIEKGTKDAASQEVKKDVSSLRYIALPNWVHDALLESSLSKSQDDCIFDVPESSGNSNPTAAPTNPSTNLVETLTVETLIPTDERGIVIRNKARLVAQGNTQEEGIDYDEVFAPVARIEAIRLFLAYASFMGFIVYQMDVKSAFLYDTIDEEVSSNTHMDKENPWGKDGTGKAVDLHLYRSMIGSLMYLTASRPDIMFDIIVATSTTEAEYVAAVSGCGQVLWIQNQLLNYGDCFKKKLISVDHIYTDENVADLLTKPFDAGRFQYLVNIGFHPIVDFVKASHIRYALTFNPTVYVSHIRQFWSTARIETTEKRTKILATVDGNLRTVTESSIRRNLKLNDEARLSSLPDAELFENLTLMGYNISPNQKFTFQKGQFSHQWKYLIHTIMQCLSPKSTWFNEFSSNIAIALVCLATNKTYNFSKIIFDGLVKNVNNKISKFLMYPSLSFSRRIIPLFDYMLIPPGEGSGTPTKPHHTPSSEAQHTSHTPHSSPTLPPVTTAPILTVTPSDTPHLRQYTRRAKIAQSSALPPIADEPASLIGDVSQGEACPTVSGLAAEQDRENIVKSSTLPSDSTPRVTSLAADEGSMQQKLNELTALCTSLQRQHSEMVLEITELKVMVKFLEDREGGGIAHSGDDALIKERRLDEGEAAAERLSSDTKEIRLDEGETAAERVVPTAAAVATATVSIPTGSGVVPTASPPISTVAPIFATATTVTPYTRRKGKEKMVEADTPKTKKLQEQIDVQFARELKKEMEREAQMMNAQIA